MRSTESYLRKRPRFLCVFVFINLQFELVSSGFEMVDPQSEPRGCRCRAWSYPQCYLTMVPTVLSYPHCYLTMVPTVLSHPQCYLTMVPTVLSYPQCYPDLTHSAIPPRNLHLLSASLLISSTTVFLRILLHLLKYKGIFSDFTLTAVCLPLFRNLQVPYHFCISLEDSAPFWRI